MKDHEETFVIIVALGLTILGSYALVAILRSHLARTVNGQAPSTQPTETTPPTRSDGPVLTLPDEAFGWSALDDHQLERFLTQYES
jgi:hypothetical protein